VSGERLTAGDGGGGGSGDDSVAVTSVAKALAPLVPFIGLLLDFVRDPQDFILERVLTWAVARLIEAGAFIGGVLEGIWRELGTSLVSTFDPVFRGGDQILSGVLEAIASVNLALASVVSVAGPVAPILVTLFWAAIVFAIVYSLRLLIKAVPYVGQFA
jgi:hypothetical protein